MFIKKVILALQKAKIDYAIVGGYAVALHGAVRGTVDIDFVISLNQSQLSKFEVAMESLNLRSVIPVTATEIYNFKDEYIKNKNLIAWNFVNPINPVESVDVLLTHDLKGIKTINKKLGSTQVVIASIESLVEMKKSAGRKQDLEDIKALESLK